MNTKILNYRIIIEPDSETGTGKPGYTALCPTLGVADDGTTIEEALTNVRDAMRTYINSLIEDSLPVPADKPEQDILTTTQIRIDKPFQFA